MGGEDCSSELEITVEAERLCNTSAHSLKPSPLRSLSKHCTAEFVVKTIGLETQDRSQMGRVRTADVNVVSCMSNP